MFAATHFDNLLVFLFFAIAIFFQILTSAAAKSRKRRGDTQRRSTSPSQMSRPLPREEESSDEDQIRKFLEALGQPTSSKPPPPVAQRPTYQRPIVIERTGPTPKRRPTVFSPLPPLTTRPPDLPTETTPPTPELVPVTQTTAPEAYETASKPVSKSAGTKMDVVSMLRSTSGLRDAIILREIFGPPRSMQPLDLVGNV